MHQWTQCTLEIDIQCEMKGHYSGICCVLLPKRYAEVSYEDENEKLKFWSHTDLCSSPLFSLIHGDVLDRFFFFNFLKAHWLWMMGMVNNLRFFKEFMCNTCYSVCHTVQNRFFIIIWYWLWTCFNFHFISFHLHLHPIFCERDDHPHFRWGAWGSAYTS